MTGDTFTRRDFLRVAAGAAAVAATEVGCGSGSDKRKPSGAAAKHDAPKGERALRIAQWAHYVPAYDSWFDEEYTRRWGDEHEVDVIVDHVPIEALPDQAATEVAAQRATTSSPSPPPLQPTRTRSSTTESSSRRSWPSSAP